MKTVIYDETFEGLLTAVHYILKMGWKMAEIVPSDSVCGLLFNGEPVETDNRKVRLVLEEYLDIVGKKAMRDLFLCFLADRCPRERLILDYLLLTFIEKKNITGLIHRDVVKRFMTTVRRVSHEIHRFTGLLRFQEIADGSFYAPFEPDNNIIVPLARHFSKRMPDVCWMIHDRGRKLGIFWDGKEFLSAELNSVKDQFALAEKELFFQSCWTSFHKKVSIEERRNPDLQRQFMPLRYWKYLTELN
jgi:probable DNA metabolism protein